MTSLPRPIVFEIHNVMPLLDFNVTMVFDYAE